MIKKNDLETHWMWSWSHIYRVISADATDNYDIMLIPIIATDLPIFRRPVRNLCVAQKSMRHHSDTAANLRENMCIIWCWVVKKTYLRGSWMWTKFTGTINCSWFFFFFLDHNYSCGKSMHSINISGDWNFRASITWSHSLSYAFHFH